MKKTYLSLSRMAVTGLFLCLFGIIPGLTSCSSSDDISGADSGSGNENGDGSSSGSDEAVKNGKGSYFIAVKTDNGTEYIMQTNSLTAGNLDIRNNIMELPQTEYTWIFNNHDAIGMVYQQQFAGLGYGLRWTSDDSQFSKLGEFRIDTRFSNYGFFNNQLLTSVGGQVSADGKRNTNDGVKLDHTKTIWTEDITGNGQQVTFSSIIDNGDGTFLTAMVQSAFHQTGTGDGSSIGDVRYPDSVWVAKMDKNLNILKVYRDDRISYAAGQYRSQVLHEVFKTNDGTVYSDSCRWLQVPTCMVHNRQQVPARNLQREEYQHHDSRPSVCHRRYGEQEVHLAQRHPYEESHHIGYRDRRRSDVCRRNTLSPYHPVWPRCNYLSGESRDWCGNQGYQYQGCDRNQNTRKVELISSYQEFKSSYQ